MKSSDLRALTRARRAGVDSVPDPAPAAQPAVPESVGLRAEWPTAPYDGLRRLRLTSDRDHFLTTIYRRDYRDAVAGDAEAIERYRAAVRAIHNDNMRLLADQVIGEGSILWNLVGGDREQYQASKAALMIAFSRLREHYRARFGFELRW